MTAVHQPEPQLFAALADPTRLALVSRLQHQRRGSTTQLATGTGLSRQAVRKHLDVLNAAGLVRNCRQGRQRLWELDARPLRRVSDWAAQVQRQWEARFDQLDALLLTMEHHNGQP